MQNSFILKLYNSIVRSNDKVGENFVDSKEKTERYHEDHSKEYKLKDQRNCLIYI